MTDAHIRLMRLEDVDFAMKLKNDAGWNQLPEDWERFLELEPDGCFVAELAGEPVGTATTLSYGKRFGWVGMVLVASPHRRRGIGTALLEHAVRHLEKKGVKTVKLDATPMGKFVYDRMGFMEEYRLERREGRGRKVAASLVTPLKPMHLKKVAGWDARVFGADRSRVLAALLHDCPGEAELVLARDGAVRGYAFVRRGTRAFHLGPWVARDAEAAEELFKSALTRHVGEPLYTDICLAHGEAVRITGSHGFAAQRSLVRMYRGPNAHPGRPELVYGVSDPAKG